MLENILYKFNC